MSAAPTPCPERAMALHALVDGELDPLTAVALEAHLRDCASCRAELGRLEGLRAVLADPALRHAAPRTLRARVLAETAGLGRPEQAPAWRGWLGGGAIGALAACLALFFALPQLAEPGLEGALIDGHIRSLQANHLIDVPTSDRHVVKPWFNGRIDFAPPVVNLAGKGFALVGGRLDVIAGRDVAVLVYRRRLHTINLFIRPAPRLASPLGVAGDREGYNLLRWTQGGLEFWAISDLDAGELAQFRDEFTASQGAAA